MSTLSDVSFPGHRFYRKLLMGDYIFFGRDHFKIYCVIFLLGQGLEMFFSYFSSGMLVVIGSVFQFSRDYCLVLEYTLSMTRCMNLYIYFEVGTTHNKFQSSLHAGD